MNLTLTPERKIVDHNAGLKIDLSCSMVRSLNDQLHQQTMSLFLIYLSYRYCNFPPNSPVAVKIVLVEGLGLHSVLMWLEAVPGIRNSLIPPPLHLPGLRLFGDSGKDQSRSYKGLNLPISQPRTHRYKKGCFFLKKKTMRPEK